MPSGSPCFVRYRSTPFSTCSTSCRPCSSRPSTPSPPRTSSTSKSCTSSWPGEVSPLAGASRAPVPPTLAASVAWRECSALPERQAGDAALALCSGNPRQPSHHAALSLCCCLPGLSRTESMCSRAPGVWLGRQTPCLQMPAMLLLRCVTLDELLNRSVPQFPHHIKRGW